MSGGVLSDYGTYTFVKVKFDCDDNLRWFICDFDVEEGDRVSAPYGVSALGKPATVIKVERNVSGQIAPVPVKHTRSVISKL